MTIQKWNTDSFNLNYLRRQGFAFSEGGSRIYDCRNLSGIETDSILKEIAGHNEINLFQSEYRNSPRVLFQSSHSGDSESFINSYLPNNIPKISAYNSDNYGTLKVMGIVNVTPDSFSDGGRYFEQRSALELCEKYLSEGADILDIGGESSRPGSEPVVESQERRRVIPLIEKICNKFPDAFVSVDTTKSVIADEALKNGARIINDISAGKGDPKMFEIVASHNSEYIMMHMQGNPKTMQTDPYYDDVIAEVFDFFEERIRTALMTGVKKIIIDPGIGFGKRVNDNLDLIQGLGNFKDFGFPLLIGLSRKSFIGKILKNEISERDSASSIADTISVINGASIVRTHNVKNAVELKKIIAAFRGLSNV